MSPRSTSTTILFLAFLLVLPASAFAQGIRFGVKGGIPISEYFETGPRYSSVTRRYTVGPSIEVNLWNNFGLEFDAMYKRIGYAATGVRDPGPFQGIRGTSTFDVKGSSWDFPLMVKYRFGESSGPYLAGGGVIRHIGPIRALGVKTVENVGGGTSTTTPIDTSDPVDLRKRTWPGLVIASGVEFGRGRFRVLPEFRYTRITSNIGEPTQSTLRFNQNQTEFLLGFLF